MAQCVVCSTEIKDEARFCPACGAEQPRAQTAGTSDDPLMGKVVARKFKIEKLLGVGGMGKVYKACQLSLDKTVVVKVLHDQFRDDPQLVQRFQREAKAASRLNHPNSIQILDFGQDESGVVFMAMEFLHGQDLFSLLKKEGPLPGQRLARIMIQAASALAEAHAQKVVHRDLKPENIMIEDRRGQRDFVKVLDFGIAKLQDPGEGQKALTQAGMVCGTPEYMSPEQARGLNIDSRSDIYSLGIVMYQLTVGELPFVSDTPIGIVTKHILEAPVPPRQRAPQLNISEELERIILQAMEKEPEKRFATVSDLAEALEQLVSTLLLREAPLYPIKTWEGDSSSAFLIARPVLPVAGGPAPTMTKPTPAVARGAEKAGAELPSTPEKSVPPAVAPSGGRKIAALSFACVVVVVCLALAVVKFVIPATNSVADAGVAPAVVDAGGTPVLVDAGLAPALVDAGSVVAALILDAGPVQPGASDAGVPGAKIDGGTSKSSKASRAAAEAVFREAHAKFVMDDCDGAIRGLGKAAQMDPTYAEPMRDIAMCQKKIGSHERACGAAKEFVKRKKMSGPVAEQTLAVFCK